MVEGCHRHRARPTPSGRSRLVFEADDMVAICRSRAHPSPPNDVSRTNGRWRMIGSTESVVISSLLGRRSRLVSFFRRRPPPQEPRPEQKLGGESLLADAGSGEGDSVVKYHNRKWRFHVIVLTTERATSRHSRGPAFARNRRFCDGRHSGRGHRETRLTRGPGPLSERAAMVRLGGANAQFRAKDRAP